MKSQPKLLKQWIRDRYSRIPYPTGKKHKRLGQQQVKTAQAYSQEDSTFPVDGHQVSLNKANKNVREGDEQWQ